MLLNYLHAELEMGAHIGPSVYRIRKRIDVETSTTLAFDQSQRIDAAEVRNREVECLKLKLHELGYVTTVIAAVCVTRSLTLLVDIARRFRIWQLIVMLVIVMTMMLFIMFVRFMIARCLMLVCASGVAKSVVHTAPERHV